MVVVDVVDTAVAALVEDAFVTTAVGKVTMEAAVRAEVEDDEVEITALVVAASVEEGTIESARHSQSGQPLTVIK